MAAILVQTYASRRAPAVALGAGALQLVGLLAPARRLF
jgi:hypothetical protein